jgi:hypothetical protein
MDTRLSFRDRPVLFLLRFIMYRCDDVYSLLLYPIYPHFSRDRFSSSKDSKDTTDNIHNLSLIRLCGLCRDHDSRIPLSTLARQILVQVHEQSFAYSVGNGFSLFPLVLFRVIIHDGQSFNL